MKRQCINAQSPDLYGHYREAKFTQTKHHWFWKANMVFNGLDVTKYHTGNLTFLVIKCNQSKIIFYQVMLCFSRKTTM